MRLVKKKQLILRYVRVMTGSMESQQQMDAVVSMIMVNLPFPPMPVMVRRGSGDEASCSSHDLLSRAISCSMMECWQCLDSDAKQSKDLKERQKQKMQVLLDLNKANATLREDTSIKMFPRRQSMNCCYVF